MINKDPAPLPSSPLDEAAEASAKIAAEPPLSPSRDVPWTPGPWLPVKQTIGSREFWVVMSRAGRLPETEGNATVQAAAPAMAELLYCLFEDERFTVAIGGNPIMVGKLMGAARDLLAHIGAP